MGRKEAMWVAKYAWVVTCLVLISVTPVLSVTEAEEDAQEAIKASATGVESTLETIVFAVMTGFCAICLSFVVVVMTCYDFLEDRTIRRYKIDGVPVQARVLSIDSVLGRRIKSGISCSPDVEPELEYVALVEYKQVEKTCYYAAHVQKQVRAMGKDFQEQTKRESPNIELELDDSVDFSEELNSAEGPPKQLELLVIPTFPRSGLTRNYVDRVSTLKHRLPSYAFSFSALLIVIFLVFATVKKIPTSLASPAQQLHYAVGFTFALICIESIMTFYFLGSWINHMIEDEYIGQEMAVIQSDVSLWSISTKETNEMDARSSAL